MVIFVTSPHPTLSLACCLHIAALPSHVYMTIERVTKPAEKASVFVSVWQRKKERLCRYSLKLLTSPSDPVLACCVPGIPHQLWLLSPYVFIISILVRYLILIQREQTIHSLELSYFQHFHQLLMKPSEI